MRALQSILTLKDAAPPAPTLEDVLHAVVKVTKVPLRELYAHRRYKPYCRARQIYFYAATVLTGEKCDAVSGLLNRDRSTSSYAHQLIKRDPSKFEPELSRVLSMFNDFQAAAA